MSQFEINLINKEGKTISSAKNINLKYSPISPKQGKELATALFGNVYGYGNAGKYKNRFYALSDNNNGLDTYSRQLIVRWTRELTAQLPVVKSAIDIITWFAVGNAYLPQYKGKNESWWKEAEAWLLNDYYPHCCTRGYDFQTAQRLISKTILTDGELLQVQGNDSNNFPMFQLIPTNRIASVEDNYIIKDGEYKGCMISDGIVYTMAGTPVAFCVQNSENLVNTFVNQSPEVYFSAEHSHLIGGYDFIDKARSLPKVAYSVLQAMSIQELDSYLMDKIKIESLVGLIEATPTGEAPQELQNTLNNLLSETGLEGNTLQLSPQDHALEIKQGPDIRYVKANGGDIRSLASNTPSDQTGNYMSRLERQITLSLGVHSELMYHLGSGGGRLTSAIEQIFNKAVMEQQAVLDKSAKISVGIALAKAMALGLIPENDEEIMTDIISFTHPPKLSLDKKYDNDIVLENLEAGVISFNDATIALCNKSASDVMDEQAIEQKYFYAKAKEVSEESGIELSTVINNWKKTAVKVSVSKTDDSTSQKEPNE
jgi:hypothetical protein